MRFNELLKIGCDIDPKTLSRVLKYLTKELIVRREVLGAQPFTVRYALTDKGEQGTLGVSSSVSRPCVSCRACSLQAQCRFLR